MNDNFTRAPYDPEPKKSKSKKSIKMPTDKQIKLILAAFALAAIALLALTKTILYFGPKHYSVIRGIFSIFIYAISISGMALSYLDKRKPSFELFLNVGAFVATLWFL